MSGNILIGFIAGVGVTAWVFNKMQHNNGNQTKNSIIVALVAGVAAMLLLTVIIGKFVPAS